MSTYRPSIAERIAWSSGQLSASDVKVLVALWSCGDYETGRNCRMYVSTLVTRSGLSRATVMRTLARLRDTKQPGGPWILASQRHRHATRYDLCLDRLATRPPKEQQMTMTPTIAVTPDAPPTLAFESQIETQIEFESQNEMQPTKSESQFETPTSDPDLVPNVRTHTPRAREDALPLLGPTPPLKCQHPHTHAWCDGRVHVPRDLHFEMFEKLNTLPGETKAQKAGRLVAFYAATMAALPATTAVGDSYQFWKTAYAAWVRTLNTDAVPQPPADAPRETVWTQILEQLESRVNRHTFETWFRPLVLVTQSAALIEVTKPGPQSGIFAEWIPRHYGDVVREAVDAVRPGARLEVLDVWAIRLRQQA